MEQDEFNAYVVDGFNENLDTSPISQSVVVYNSTNLSSGTLIKAIIQNNSNDNSSQDNVRQIIGKRGSFASGQYVFYQAKLWLIDSLIGDNLVYIKATMTYCNYTQHFLNSGGSPIFRPCCVNDSSSYTPGIKSSGIVKIESGTVQFVVKMPLDSETNLLDRTYLSENNEPMRLLVDYYTSNPMAYRITHVDRITCPGCVLLSLLEDVRNENDNVELMIADYYNRFVESPAVPTPTIMCEISYSGEAILEIGKGYKTFTAIFRDESGNTSFSIMPVWDIVLSDMSLEQYVIYETSDNTIKIKVSEPSMNGIFVTLNLSDEENTMSSSVMLEVAYIG